MDRGLEVAGLRKGFGKTALIEDATFSVAPGEVVCLTGDNGAGKSTLLRCLIGLARYEGSASLDGVDLRRPEALARIGYVPQSPALVETATVAETLEFYAALGGVEPDLTHLSAGFLPPFGDRVGHLSGGHRQRLALPIGFMRDPDLLLLDEPTANLDDAGRNTTRALIRSSADGGSAIVIVSPAAVDLVSIVDRILVLRDGIVARGEELYEALLPKTHRMMGVPA